MDYRNVGIFAHVDAGKTTLSEQLLVHSGKIRAAGSVDKGTAHTDDLPVERRRGISVKAASVELVWKDTLISLIDTPGHTDFSAEIEKSMWAIDAAVIVVDAVKGIQPQTETLFNAAKKQKLPCLFFLNKTDRPEADPDKVILQIRDNLTDAVCPLWDEEKMTDFVCNTSDELLEKYLEEGAISKDELNAQIISLTHERRAYPALFGSALQDKGIEAFLDAMITYLPAPDKKEEELAAVAFAVTNDRVMGRGLWVRMYGGKLENRMPVDVKKDYSSDEKNLTEQRKITQIRGADGEDKGVLGPGDVGVVYGLGNIEVGHIFGNSEKIPRIVKPGSLRTPLIMVKAVPEKPEDLNKLREILMEMSLEDPLLNARYIKATGELLLQIMGMVQIEILQEILQTRYEMKVSFEDPAVIYKETIRKKAKGFVAYTMPKPCWAILDFEIEPAPRGSGITFKSVVGADDIMPRYQHQVEQALPKALSQGRLGWEVVDLNITLVGGEHHLEHTHPLDFIVATPMAIQDGLVKGESVLLEPMLDMRFVVPTTLAGRIMSDVQLMRGELGEVESKEEISTISAIVPVATSIDYPTTFAAITGGKGSISTALHGYRECSLEEGKTAPRRGVDPLDTSKYILAARNALGGEIFD